MTTVICDASMLGKCFPSWVCVKRADTGVYQWVALDEWSNGELAEPCAWDWTEYDAHQVGDGS